MPTGVYERKPRPYPDPVPRFWEKVNKNGPVPAHRPELGACWLWIGTTGGRKGDNYGKFWLRGRQVVASRFSYELHIRPIPTELQVCHHCDVTQCVRPEHLFLGTTLDNVRDAIKKGRWNYGPRDSANYSRGAANHNTKLTEEQVREIRKRYVPRKASLRRLAREYNVSKYAIFSALHGLTWKHLT